MSEKTLDAVGVMQVWEMLQNADAFRVDGGALLAGADLSTWAGEPDNEVAHFSWTEEDEDYSVTRTEEGVQGGYWEGKVFVCQDHEGNDTLVQMYRLTPLFPESGSELALVSTLG